MRDFGSAMAAMRDGQFVRRKAWDRYLTNSTAPDPKCCGIPPAVLRSASRVFVHPCIMAVEPAMVPYRELAHVHFGWHPTREDTAADDWVLCDDLGREFAP